MADINYLNNVGDFQLDDAESISGLYFPVGNDIGIKSSLTPNLGGDCKTGQNNFVLQPVSIYELHNNKSSRNFWLYFPENGIKWSATGVSSYQRYLNSSENKEKTKVNAGLLWHQTVRENKDICIKSIITTFVPGDDYVELHKIEIINTTNRKISFVPYTAVPFFGRSADNLRDHRHVTSLLHRCDIKDFGLILKPTLSFDERGHKINEISYGFFCIDSYGNKHCGGCVSVDDFIGEGGSLENPLSIGKKYHLLSGESVNGEEIIAAFEFDRVTLDANESISYVMGVSINENAEYHNKVFEKYSTITTFEKAFEKNSIEWKDKISVSFSTNSIKKDAWLRWVSAQPILRKIFGCSFLPHHDYGKGGRGWRDLWQDCLTLLLFEPNSVRDNLISFVSGIRTDGSNATIIGNAPGEFIADRNGVARVWSDHAAWPLFTIMLYIEQTGDISILLEKEKYFRDQIIYRGTKSNPNWKEEQETWQKDNGGNVYLGTVLEHILVQNLCAYYCVGEHNIIKLEGGDWNDGLDMAKNRGEGVAFSFFYCQNLKRIVQLCNYLILAGIQSIQVSKLLLVLINGESSTLEDKLDTFNYYIENCDDSFCSETVDISLKELISQLEKKYAAFAGYLKRSEWVDINYKEGFYNSYYDDLSVKTDGVFDKETRMLLTGQVFAIMSGIATDEQIRKIVYSADKYLFSDKGGYRLNTEFKVPNYKLGRLFGFAYGSKENGAVFSHMAVMYAYALYSRGFVKEGYKALNCLYKASVDFKCSKIYPGIPEYFDLKGRGLYHYLTGSASWYIFTLLTQVYGVRGENGNLLIEPKLLPEEFDKKHKTQATFAFAGRKFCITYFNPSLKDNYDIGEVKLDGSVIDSHNKFLVIPKGMLDGLSYDECHNIEVILK